MCTRVSSMRALASTTSILCRCRTTRSSKMRDRPLPCRAQQIDPVPRHCGQVLPWDLLWGVAGAAEATAEAGVRQPSLRSRGRRPTVGRSTGRARVVQEVKGQQLHLRGEAYGDQRQLAYRSTWVGQVGGEGVALAQQVACARAQPHSALGLGPEQQWRDLEQVQRLARPPPATTPRGRLGEVRAHRKVALKTTIVVSWPRI